VFEVNETVPATLPSVVGKLETSKPPPLDAWLALNVVESYVAVPVPIPPGAAKAKASEVAPPPPVPNA